MKKNIVNFLRKASMNMVEKKASVGFYGEKKIPAEMLAELEKKSNKK